VNESPVPARIRDRLAREGLGAPVLGIPVAAWFAAAVVPVVLLAVSGAYGFHRDEMYFILAGRHPAWGYVDQPPLTPLLSAAAAGILGVTPTAVRLAPALASAAVILLAADMSRRLGGSRTAQALAALVLAASGWVGAGHLDETVTYDILCWTLALWLLVGILASPEPTTRDRRRWLALGLVMGLALENKTLAVSLAATVGASLVLLRRWDVLRQPWPWLGALLALGLWMPNLVWQAENGFPQLTMAQRIAANQGPGLEGRLKALVELLVIAGALLAPVAIAGVAWLLRAPAARGWRPLGLVALLQLGLMLAVNGKSYYSAGFLPLLVAAGSIPLDGWLRRGRVRLRRGAFAAAAVLSGTLVWTLMLPFVPVGSLNATPIPGLYSESVAQVGWPELARQVEAVIAALPPGQRGTAVIVTADYGQYSSLRLLGSGLPPVYSGHNSTWDWGSPPDDAGPVVLVAFSDAFASEYFTGCRVAATIDNGYGLPTQEQGAAIRLCAAPLRPWPELWPSMRHID